MRIENDVKLAFKDVLIRPKRSTLSSRKQVSLDRTFTFKHAKKSWTGVPIIAANMSSVASFEMAVALAKNKIVTAVHKHYSVEAWLKFGKEHKEALPYVAISAGIGKSDLEAVNQVMKVYGDQLFGICIDVANAYCVTVEKVVSEVRKQHPKAVIMAGNVVTGEMTEQLILSGADIVKVGIGPGSVCTTRRMTGVGYPQLSAVIECADAAHGLGAQIISDGGCTSPGDVAKAFGGGADFVMLGGMFAAHTESGGEIITGEDGKKFMSFYGMSSGKAMKKYAGKIAEYRASEGKQVHLPYRGPVQHTVNDILGGIRSACTYTGARKLKELTKRTTFIRVTQTTNEHFQKFNVGPTKRNEVSECKTGGGGQSSITNSQ